MHATKENRGAVGIIAGTEKERTESRTGNEGEREGEKEEGKGEGGGEEGGKERGRRGKGEARLGRIAQMKGNKH